MICVRELSDDEILDLHYQITANVPRQRVAVDDPIAFARALFQAARVKQVREREDASD